MYIDPVQGNQAMICAMGTRFVPNDDENTAVYHV